MSFLTAKHRLKSALKYAIRDIPDNLLLDIGPGSGEELDFLRNSEVVIIDLSDTSLTRTKYKAKLAIKADINCGIPLKSDTLHCIFASHVLEHVESPAGVLKELNRILRNDGTLILGLPHEGWLVEKFRPYFSPYHLYSFSLNGISHLLSFCGFEVSQFYFDMPYRLGILANVIMTYMAQLLPKGMIFPLSPSYWVIARRTSKPKEVRYFYQ